jgi:FecR protein
MSEPHDDYLWDKTGAPDPDVQRLEVLLSPFAHDDRAFGPQRRRRRMALAIAAVAAVLLTTALVMWSLDHPNQLKLVNTTAKNALLLQGSTVVTTGCAEELVLEDGLSEITVAPGSVVHVDRLKQELTQLRLERGSLHAFVSAEAKARFFQVQTPATNCVDLGCMYTLDVDAAGNAHVAVEMGRVAFEDGGREVVVPAGATCAATRQHGAGTPRHNDTPLPVVKFLAGFDAERGPDGAAQRLRLARRVLGLLAGAEAEKHSLIVWHFLQDPAPAVSTVAARWLVANCARHKPSGFVVPKAPGERVSARDRKSWRAKLEEFWGW